jgi:aspartate racemase
MSWESTVPYYQKINEFVKIRLGGLHSARIILYSVDFHDIERLQHLDRWEEASKILISAAKSLEVAGADFLILCTNTMHKIAPSIESAVSIPLLHIADATALEVKRACIQTIGLLGTRFTMEQEFYRERFEKNHGIKVLIPEEEDREFVHRVIYDELCLGLISNTSREHYRKVIDRLVQNGAEGVIFGCTEISMLVSQSDSPVPVFDTTSIHADSAVNFAFQEK